MPEDRARSSTAHAAAELERRLAAFVAGEAGLPEAQVRISGLRRLAGGASRELWSLDLELGAGAEARCLPLVLRRDPPGRSGESDRGLEFRVLRAAAAAGVPVPQVRWCATDPAVLGAPFFLMDRVPGETLPRRLLRDAAYARAREGMAGRLGEILAAIHRVDLSRPELAGLAEAGPGQGSAQGEVLRIAAGIRQLSPEPHPVLDLAERWLLARAPAARRPVLVHGDYRVGNLVFDEQGVRAVLDWELAHVGDPVEDLGWLCVRAWRFGNDALPVGGVGTREELVRAYEAAGGDPVDPGALRFWEACGNFKLALVFITQARVFLDGLPSLELASLGRRTAEAERELLALMGAAPGEERPSAGEGSP
jgi:aminoglycoside phosphotransferase (APT) family kinase protein